MSAHRTARVPVMIVNAFVFAGKTTLVRRYGRGNAFFRVPVGVIPDGRYVIIGRGRTAGRAKRIIRRAVARRLAETATPSV